MSARIHRSLRPQRGAATLAVVMVLFFILAMVAAYTNRTMIFEQRTSANSFRAAQSMGAAEASIDWTLAMLNGGAIGPACTAAGATTEDFRNRYFELQADGLLKARPGLARPACIATDTGWNCSCPAGPASGLVVDADVMRPVFTVRMTPPTDRPGLISLRTRGCDAARSGTINAANLNGAGSCHIAPIDEDYGSSGNVRVDSMVTLDVAVALVPALPVAPSAAMTVRGTVDQSAGELRITNPDNSTGVALRVGGDLVDPTAVVASGPAGSSGQTVKHPDTTLVDVPAADFFRRTFNLPPALYGEQPAAMFIACPLGCVASAVTYNGDTMQLAELAARNPSRAIYVSGNLTFDALAQPSVGTSDRPTVLVVNGNLAFDRQVEFTGMVYAEGNLSWSAAAAGAGGIIRGAVVVRGDYAGAGTAAVVYDRPVIQRIRDGYGSFVRVPGSWTTRAGT